MTLLFFRRPIFVLVLVLVLISLDVSAQPVFRARHLTVSDGLSSNIIRCVFQDSKGFVWIGTRNGLNKYDGYSFRNYFYRPFDKNGLQNNIITAITEDSSGYLWIGTGMGISRLDRKTDRFISFLNNPSDSSSIGFNEVISLLVDSKKRLWVALKNGEIDLFDAEHSTFKRYKNIFPAFNTDVTMKLLEYNGEYLAVPSYSGTALFSTITGETSFPSELNGSLFKVERSNKALLYSHHYGSPTSTLTELEPSTGHITGSNRFDSITYPSIIFSGEGKNSFYMGNADGLQKIDLSKGTMEIVTIADNLGTNLSFSLINSGICDLEGSLWLGTLNNGIFHIDKRKQRFHSYRLTSTDNPERPLESRSIFIGQDGTIWAGAIKGNLFKFEDESRIFRPVQMVNKFQSSINSIAEEEGGKALWLAATGVPIFRFLKQPRTIERFGYNSNINQHGSNGGYCSYIDYDGSIWFGGLEAIRNTGNPLILYHWVPLTNKLSLHYLPKPIGTELRGIGVWTIVGEGIDSLWLGTNNGLLLFNKQTEAFTRFIHSQTDKSTISHDNIWTLHRDKLSNLWCGTWGGGLNLLRHGSTSFEHFTMDDGLPSNVIHSMLEDSLGRLWIATAKGISRFDPKSRSFTNYSTEDGLLDDEYSPNDCAISPSGEFLFGGLNGIAGFYPRSLESEIDHSRLIFTGFNVFDTLRCPELSIGDTISLQYQENYFTIEFARLNYQGNGKNFYQYQLEGIDAGWISAGNRNTVSYNDIEPGKYLFRVRSSTSSSFENAAETSILMIIAPPIWSTIWFRSGVGVIGLSVLISIGLYRRRKRRDFEVHLEQARESERIGLAGSLHDGPLQDLYGSRFLIEPLDGATDQDNQNITKLDILLRKVRADLRTITSELQIPRFDSGFGEELIVFCDSFAGRHPEIKIDCSIIDTEQRLPIPIMQNLFRIFRTAMNNVQKHSEATRCVVSLVRQSKGMALIIQDNGKGFEVSGDHATLVSSKHYGLFLMQSYARTANATCEVISKLGEGTTIKIEFSL